jgi:drug/metabolite transporter (DMT)-like permease
MAIDGVVGGITAASCWGAQNALASRATRAGDPLALLVLHLAIALATLVPFLLLTGGPPAAAALDWAVVVAAGVADVIGLACVFEAFKRGRLAVVAPIASAQGAVAAVLSVLAGERLGPVLALGLALSCAGTVAAVATSGKPAAVPGGSSPRSAAALAVAGCAAIGVSLFALGSSAGAIGPLWGLAILRAAGLCVLLPYVRLRGRDRVRGAAPMRMMAASAVCDNVGFGAFIAATANAGVAVPAVLGSQYSVVAMLIGIALFGERLGRAQAVAVVTIVLGVGIVAAAGG